MTALTTRDTLAKALHQMRVFDERHPQDRSKACGYCVNMAHRLFASGAVIDAATLADDEAAFDAVVAKMRSQVGSTRADRVREVFDALAAAITERAQ